MTGFAEAKQAANQRAQQVGNQSGAKPASRAMQPLSPNGPLSGSGLVFEGPSESDTQYIPPDSQIAAGPNHLVVAINSLLAIYDKSGNKLGGYQDLGTFFASLGITGEIFDPRLVYDQADGRFILSVADVDMTHFTRGYVLLAVSQTSDPTGAWYKYAIDFTGVNPITGRRTLPDFPGLGIGGNDLYLTTNQFEISAACLAGDPNEVCAFSDAWIKAIGLAELLAGNPSLNIVTFKNIHTASNQLAFGIQPALTYGSSSYEFFVAASFAYYSVNVLDLFSVNAYGNPTLQTAELTVPYFYMPPDAVQGGSYSLIMTNDFRPLNAVWANNSLWFAHNVEDLFNSGVLARWYQIQLSDLASASLVQSGDVSGPGSAYFPAISVKADGTVGMAFTTSNSTLPASAAFTAREPADAPGAMRGYAIYRPGTGPYDEPTDNRWGDYSGISVDPDGNSFWTIAEYAGAPDPHFGTAIAQMSTPPSLSVTPSHLYFGQILYGRSSNPQALTFQNIGDTTVTLGAITKAGVNPADFAVLADQCSGVSLGAGQNCSVTVVFTPSLTFMESAYLSLGAGGGSVSVDMSGSGVIQAVITVSPHELDFPGTPEQTASAPMILTVSNSGNAPAQIGSLSLWGPFTQTNNCVGPINPGSSCQFSITFYPTSATNLSGYIMFNAGEWFSISFFGTGVAEPAATLCPPSLDFGNQTTGTSSPPQTVVLTNTGNAPLTVTGIASTGDFSETNDCGGGVQPRASCRIQVTFTPSATGPRVGQITVNDATPTSPQKVGLSGAGVTMAQLQRPDDPLTPPLKQGTIATAPDLRRRTIDAERPISFEPNQGQFPPDVRYVAHMPSYALALTPGEVLFFGTGAVAGSAPVSITLAGANRRAQAEGLDQASGKANYFLGNNPKRWRTNVPTFSRVKLVGVYPGVDLVYYGTGRRLEYDFVIAPGANPKNIRLQFDPASRLSVSPEGDLLVSTAAGTMQLHKPVVYQYAEGTESSPETRRYRSGRWAVKGASIAAFRLGPYDHNRDLVIDPVVSFSTYLGGTGSDQAKAIAVDSAGNIYVAGRTNSWDFPITANAFQKICGTAQLPCNRIYDGLDGFIAKLSPDGSTLLYATYLGGSQGTDIRAIAVDSAGSAYVTGSTVATDFPLTPNAFQASCHAAYYCKAAFVTKLDPTGSFLVYSTYLGGSPTIYNGAWVPGDVGNGIAVDAQGNAYVGGSTGSADFPVTAGAYETAPPTLPYTHGFLTKINTTGTGLVFSTFIGGTRSDAVNGVAVDSSGNAYVTGQAASVDFPTSPGAFQTGSYSSDAFVIKFAPSGSLVYSTLLGGEPVFFLDQVSNQGNAIAVDPTGAAYITGPNVGGGFPVTPGAFSTTQLSGSHAFVAKLHPQGCALSYATYTGAQDARAIAIDGAGDAYVLGAVRGTKVPTAPQVPGVNALQPQLAASYPLLNEIDPTGSTMLFSTPLGGSYLDFANAITLDPAGNIFIAGNTQSADLPVANALKPDCVTCNPTGSGTAFLAKIDPNQPAAGVSLTRDELTFAPWHLNAYYPQSELEAVGLMNHQAVPLNIQSVSVTGAGYSITQNSCTGSIVPGGGCAVTVQFGPTVSGWLAGTLTIVDDSPSSPHQVLLDGLSTAGSYNANLPVGAVDQAVSATTHTQTLLPGGTLLVSGWGVDLDSAAPVGNVVVLIDGVQLGSAGLGQPRSDIAAYYKRPDFLNSGWSLSANIGNLGPGNHTVTVVAYDPDAPQAYATIGSPITITVGSHAPQGGVDQATNANNYGSTSIPPGGTLLVSGWAMDLDSPAPVAQVTVSVDGVPLGNATLGQARSDIANYFKSNAFLNSGWSFTSGIGSLAPGKHTVTVVASDADTPGVSATIGSPLTFTVANNPPQGAMDRAVNADNNSTNIIPPGGTLLVTGWAVDLDGPAPVGNVVVNIDGVPLGNGTLGQARSDIANYYKRPDLLNSGWSLKAGIGNLAAGDHTVSAVAYDADVAGVSTTIGTLTITVGYPANHVPQGAVDRAVNAANNSTNVIPPGGTLLVTGWAVDMDSPAPVAQVTVNIDGVPQGNASLGQARSDIANYYQRPDLLNCGWYLSAPIGNLALGNHTVTVVAADADAPGVSVTIGSPLTITVGTPPNHLPEGAVDTAVNPANYSNKVPPGGTLLVSGWAVDQDSAAPVAKVVVSVDGVPLGNATLGEPRSDVAAGYGRPDFLNSGWSLAAAIGNLSLGSHTVTVVAYDADAPGTSATIGSPLTFTVANSPPQGAVDQATNANNLGSSTIPQGGTLLVSGWTIDLDSAAPVAQVTVNVDGAPLGNATLGQPRSDVSAYYKRPNLLNCGWSLSASIGNLAPGNHTVTVVAYDADTPGVSATIGPSYTITVTTAP